MKRAKHENTPLLVFSWSACIGECRKRAQHENTPLLVFSWLVCIGECRKHAEHENTSVGVVRGMESLGTKLITRMPIFDRASTLIYYTRGLC